MSPICTCPSPCAKSNLASQHVDPPAWTDPLLAHVLGILFPRPAMLARVQESLQHFGITQFDEELFDLLDTKESIKALTYPNPDAPAEPARLVPPVAYRNILLDVLGYALDFNTRHSRAIDEVDWWNFTPEDFKLYLRSSATLRRRLGIQASSDVPDAAIATRTPAPAVDAASDPVLLDYVLKLLLGYDKVTCALSRGRPRGISGD